MKMYSATIDEEALTAKPAGAYYSRQKLIVIALVVLVSVIPLVGISYFTFNYYRSSWIDNTSADLATLGDSRRDVIELFLSDQNNLINSAVQLNSPQYLSGQQNLERVFTAIDQSGVITDLGVIGATGAHLAYVGPFRDQLSGVNYSGEEWFREAMAQGRFTSDIFSGFRGVPHFIVAVADPTRSFILRATVNSDLFNSLLAAAEVGPGGDAFILNRRGEAQTPSRLGSTEIPFAMDSVPVTEGSTVARRDGDFLYALTPLKDGEWILVLKQDINASLSHFYTARTSAVLIILLAIVIITTVAALLTSSIINRIKDADLQRMALNNRMQEVEKMALVGRLASSVSHEINNPLQIIENQAGWMEELLADERDGNLENLEEYREAAGKIRSHVARAREITHRLLGFSRTSEARRTSVDVNRLLDDTISFLENEADKSNITIIREFQPDAPTIVTEPAQLQQVFLNIINNAIDAIGSDGQVTIRTSNADGKRMSVEFSDTGPGLGEDTQKRIFDPFFTTKRGKNTGLGLSISYNIVQRLGGVIEAKNRAEGGASFTVTLPAG